MLFLDSYIITCTRYTKVPVLPPLIVKLVKNTTRVILPQKELQELYTNVIPTERSDEGSLF